MENFVIHLGGVVLPGSKAPDIEDEMNKTPRKEKEGLERRGRTWNTRHGVVLASLAPAGWHTLLTHHGRSTRGTGQVDVVERPRHLAAH